VTASHYGSDDERGGGTVGLYLAPALRTVRTATGTNRRDLAELTPNQRLADSEDRKATTTIYRK